MEKPKNNTFSLIKDFTKVLALEARDKGADVLYAAAEKVDISAQQETFCENFHKQLEQKRLEKERKNLKVATA